MDKDEFYIKIINSLLKQGFIFDEEAIYGYKYNVEKYNRSTGTAIDILQGAGAVFSAIAGQKAQFTSSKIDMSHIDGEEFMEDIENMRLITPYIVYKYTNSEGHFVLASIIDGDSIRTHEYKSIIKEFDSKLLNFNKYRLYVSGIKKGLYGKLLFTISDEGKSIEYLKKNILAHGVSHFWKAVYTTPYVINIHQKSVNYKGMAWPSELIDCKKLEKDLFY